MKRQYLKLLTLIGVFTLSFGTLAVPLTGTYTVGTGETYTDLVGAMNAAKTEGVSGGVVFQLKTGTYTANHNFNQISGLTALNTITIESKTGNKADVTLRSSGSNVISMYSISYVKFRNLTIDQTRSTRAVYLNSNTDNITFENCELKGYNSTSSTSSYTIIYVGYNNTNFRVENCNFTRGSYGVYATDNNCDGLKIKNNNFTNQYYAAYIQNNHDIEISGNDVKSTRSYGFRIRYSSGLKMFNNTIRSNSYSIELYRLGDGISNKSTIYNNIAGPTNSNYALYLNGGTKNTEILHNTFFSSGTVVYLGGGVSGNIQFKNNLVYSNSCNYVMQFDNGDYGDFNSDYNAYGNSSNSCSNPFYYQNNSHDFERYKGFSEKDINSIYGVPNFVSYPTDLKPQNGLFGNTGTPISWITKDINEITRNTSNPDAGALEFNAVNSDDIAIVAITSPAVPNCTGSNDIKILVRNIGNNEIASSSFDYYVNNNLEGTYNYPTALATNASVEITLGSFAFDGHNDSLKVEVKQVNSGVDSDLSNNVKIFNGIYAPVSGTQTFGMGDSLAGLDVFLNKISNGGICGPVTIKLRNGNYTKDFDFELRNVRGTSETNTITIESESGNPVDVLLRPSSNSHNGVIELGNVNYVTIKNITIDPNALGCNSALSIDGYCGELNIDNVTFLGDSSNCETIIEVDNYIDGFTMRNCRTYFGDYIFYSYGTGNSKPIVIEDNLFMNWENGIEVEDHSSLIFRNNRSITNINSAEYGLYSYQNTVSIIENNYIQLDSCNNDYALYVEDDYDKVSNTKITGNYVYAGYNPNSTFYGQFYHENVISNNTFISDSGDYCIEYYNYRQKGTLANNIFASTRQRYATAYLESGYSLPKILSSNNYYTTGVLVRDNSTYYKSIADWKKIGIEENPMNVDPMFHGVGDFHVCNPLLDGAGISVPGIGPDMDGDLRLGGTLDIGADEFSPAGSGDFMVTDNAALCKGKATLVASPGASSYLWSTGASTQSIEVIQSGTYSVAVTGICGVDGTDSVAVTSDVLEANFTVANRFGKSISLYDETKGAPTTYSWDFGDGNTSSEENPSHEYSSFGIYTITLTVTNECGTSTFELPVSTFPVSVKTVNAVELKIYPNPTNGIVTIEIENSNSLGNSITILDLTGKVVKTMDTNSSSSISIDLSELARGIYIAQMNIENQKVAVRIVKQ